MRKVFAASVVALTAGLALASEARLAQSTQVFRSSNQTVAVYVSVREQGGRLVPDLPQDAFQLLDNGKPVELTLFSNEVKPFAAVLLLDMSRSMASQYGRVVEAAKNFVEAKLDDDRIRIGSFGREVSISPLMTHDKKTLLRVLDEEIWPGGATPLWRAASMAMDSFAAEQGRRVVLAMTDGADSGGDYNCAPLVSDPHGVTGNCPGRVDVRRRAQAESFMFYAIGFEGTGLDQGLRDVTDDTGGGQFELKRNADLTATFARVADELHHQYLLGFTPTALDGKVHQLTVKLTRPGLVAVARKTYVAGERK